MAHANSGWTAPRSADRPARRCAKGLWSMANVHRLCTAHLCPLPALRRHGAWARACRRCRGSSIARTTARVLYTACIPQVLYTAGAVGAGPVERRRQEPRAQQARLPVGGRLRQEERHVGHARLQASARGGDGARSGRGDAPTKAGGVAHLQHALPPHVPQAATTGCNHTNERLHERL